jgi:Uma2 family endonuclease
MALRGDFERDGHKRRVELIYGEIRDMNPIGPPHCEVLAWINEWSITVAPREEVRIRPQSTLGIPLLRSAPEPDLVWARRRSYRRVHPQPDDIFLLIEVADTTVRYDCGEKALLYSGAGLQDYWVVNIPDECVEVFREPTPLGYRQHEKVGVAGEIRALRFPAAVLKVAELFAGDFEREDAE